MLQIWNKLICICSKINLILNLNIIYRMVPEAYTKFIIIIINYLFICAKLITNLSAEYFLIIYILTCIIIIWNTKHSNYFTINYNHFLVSNLRVLIWFIIHNIYFWSWIIFLKNNYFILNWKKILFAFFFINLIPFYLIVNFCFTKC